MVDHQQRRRPDETAGDADVIPDDRVLDRVRQRQQHDEVERIELRELPLAGQPQADDEEEVHGNGAKDLLGDRQAEREHVMQQRSIHGRMLAEVPPVHHRSCWYNANRCDPCDRSFS